MSLVRAVLTILQIGEIFAVLYINGTCPNITNILTKNITRHIFAKNWRSIYHFPMAEECYVHQNVPARVKFSSENNVPGLFHMNPTCTSRVQGRRPRTNFLIRWRESSGENLLSFHCFTYSAQNVTEYLEGVKRTIDYAIIDFEEDVFYVLYNCSQFNATTVRQSLYIVQNNELSTNSVIERFSEKMESFGIPGTLDREDIADRYNVDFCAEFNRIPDNSANKTPSGPILITLLIYCLNLS